MKKLTRRQKIILTSVIKHCIDDGVGLYYLTEKEQEKEFNESDKIIDALIEDYKLEG